MPSSMHNVIVLAHVIILSFMCACCKANLIIVYSVIIVLLCSVVGHVYSTIDVYLCGLIDNYCYIVIGGAYVVRVGQILSSARNVQGRRQDICSLCSMGKVYYIASSYRIAILCSRSSGVGFLVLEAI